MADWIEWETPSGAHHRALATGDPNTGGVPDAARVETRDVDGIWVPRLVPIGNLLVFDEMVRRGEEIAEQSDLVESYSDELKHVRKQLEAAPQLDSKDIGAGIVEALLPGVKLTKDDLKDFATLMSPSGWGKA